MEDSLKVFTQFCSEKEEKANEFITDYILYKMDVPVQFEGEKYKPIAEYLLDLCVAGDEVFNFFYYMVSLPSQEITKENFKKGMEKKLGLKEDKISKFLFGIFIANIDKFLILKNKELSNFDNDEMKNYKVNIQYDFCHSSLSNLDNKLNVLLKVEKNDSSSHIFQIEDTKLDALIDKLKDIYCQIKS